MQVGTARRVDRSGSWKNGEWIAVFVLAVERERPNGKALVAARCCERSQRLAAPLGNAYGFHVLHRQDFDVGVNGVGCRRAGGVAVRLEHVNCRRDSGTGSKQMHHVKRRDNNGMLMSLGVESLGVEPWRQQGAALKGLTADKPRGQFGVAGATPSLRRWKSTDTPKSVAIECNQRSGGA